MRVKILTLAVALLCLLAMPATALAADELDSPKIDPSVQIALEAADEANAVPVLVFATDDISALADLVPIPVETTPWPRRCRGCLPHPAPDRDARRQ